MGFTGDIMGSTINNTISGFISGGFHLIHSFKLIYVDLNGMKTSFSFVRFWEVGSFVHPF